MTNPLKTEENCKYGRELLECYESSDKSTAIVMRALVKKFNDKRITVAFDSGVLLVQDGHLLRVVREEEK